MADLLKHLHWKLTQAPPTDARGRLLGGRTFTEQEVRPLLELAEVVVGLDVPDALIMAMDYLVAVEDEPDQLDSVHALHVLREAASAIGEIVARTSDSLDGIQGWTP